MFPIQLVDCSLYLYDLCRLADCAFGEGYLRPADFMDESSRVWGAFNGDQLNGFLLCYVQDIQCFDIDWLTEIFGSGNRRLVSIKSMCVSPHARRQGIAFGLLEQMFRYFEPLEVEGFYTVLWKKDGQVPIAALFESFGFFRQRDLPRFWYRNSLLKQYNCKVCGLPPCCCDAVLYCIKY